MFTGIVEKTGKILKVTKTPLGKKFSVEATSILKNKKIGQSIAVNGVCVTITKIGKDSFEFDAIPETLELTNLGTLKKSDPVNLEPPLKLNQELDGHIVLGHVDGTGKVLSLKKGKRAVLTIKFPQNLSKYIALKGSICLNGVSLTVSDLQEDNFSVELIPHTLKKTNLGNQVPENVVNLEIDVVARYLERLLNNKEKETTYEFLKERNLI